MVAIAFSGCARKSPLQLLLVVVPGPPESNPITQACDLQPVVRYGYDFILAGFATIYYLTRDNYRKGEEKHSGTDHVSLRRNTARGRCVNKLGESYDSS